MCYNRAAVEFTAKQALVSAGTDRSQPSAHREELAQREPSSTLAGEDASRYCPVCSQRLESRRCKLICPVCGYYMSCADYY